MLKKIKITLNLCQDTKSKDLCWLTWSKDVLRVMLGRLALLLHRDIDHVYGGGEIADMAPGSSYSCSTRSRLLSRRGAAQMFLL